MQGCKHYAKSRGHPPQHLDYITLCRNYPCNLCIPSPRSRDLCSSHRREPCTMWLPNKIRDSSSSYKATLPSHRHRGVQGKTPGVAVVPLQVLHVQHLPTPDITRDDWPRTQAGYQTRRHPNLSHHPPQVPPALEGAGTGGHQAGHQDGHH